MNKNKIRGLIYGAFIADAISLGPHLIYNTEDIYRHYHPIKGYSDPVIVPYHKGKKAGDLTHYGDQSLALLKSIAATRGFDFHSFKKSWLSLMTKGELYIDQATEDSIGLLQDSDTGASNSELGGLARSAPLFAVDHVTEDMIVTQIRMTHNEELTTIIARFFIRVILEVLNGSTVGDAMERHSNIHEFVYDSYENALVDKSSIIEGIKAIGQSCSSRYVLPCILTVLLKEEDFRTAITANAYAGGDSASRAMILGMIYGARDGFEKLPSEWVRNLNAYEEIEACLIALGL